MTRSERPAIDLHPSALASIQSGTMRSTWRGIPSLKCPFDLAIYGMVLWDLKPATVLEFGSFKGGSALWLADQMSAMGLATHVHSFDLRPPDLTDSRITFAQFDAASPANGVTGEFLASLPHPWLVIEDSSHTYSHVLNILRHLEPHTEPGDRIIIEDGIVDALGLAPKYDGGPLRAIPEFLAETDGRWAIDPAFNDFFGVNMTWNQDGYLIRLAGV